MDHDARYIFNMEIASHTFGPREATNVATVRWVKRHFCPLLSIPSTREWSDLTKRLARRMAAWRMRTATLNLESYFRDSARGPVIIGVMEYS